MRNRSKRMTGQSWAKKYSINIVDYAGFATIEKFKKELIDKETFLFRASNCTLSEPVDKSRRVIHDFKFKL